MSEVCKVPGCRNENKPYCRLHNIGISVKKQPTPIAARSKKLSEVMKKEYVPQVKEMVKAGTPCKVNSPVCTGKAQGFHHLQGKDGELLTNKKKKVPCCNPCNGFIERNDAWARANGFKLSKFLSPSKNQRIAIINSKT
jgi:hypothetical protein